LLACNVKSSVELKIGPLSLEAKVATVIKDITITCHSCCCYRSVAGFMHMKIVANHDGRFILGQFSQPFYNIAQMLHYYTMNKLPIKGAEHISLSIPVPREPV